ncbi:MAG: MBL fold metallo-hydrolase [Acidimicrobiia bacterium]|jgi:glyoxylase-like metal-dependent hydrolase (beta-lactamase superfamily II)|nr:MBL fold metallo-hydrolase [Acidimicrobiia bacterium]
MGVTIPFVKDMRFAYGEAEQVSPLVRRVVTRNPGLFTFHGTNTYLVGRGRVVVIDPGPLLKEHQAALRRALGGETVSHILVTHRHLDHCEGAAALAQETGAVLAAAGPGAATPALPGHHQEEGVDPAFAPGLILRSGDRVEGPDWRLEVRATPGHTSDHLCFALPQDGILFTGDHVMGWSTSVVIPPDGDMRAYVASLRLLQARDDRAYLPGHGPAILTPRPFVTALVAHRAEREREILRAIGAGRHHIPGIVQVVYADVDPRLHPAAGLSVLAHLRALVAEKRVTCSGPPTLEAEFGPGR